MKKSYIIKGILSVFALAALIFILALGVNHFRWASQGFDSIQQMEPEIAIRESWIEQGDNVLINEQIIEMFRYHIRQTRSAAHENISWGVGLLLSMLPIIGLNVYIWLEPVVKGRKPVEQNI